MTISINVPDIHELKPRITVFGVGGAGGNAVNNMITAGLQGVDFVVANTDAQALTMSKAQRIVQMGTAATQGLGAGSQPVVGAAAAEEVMDELRDHLSGANMVFVTAGMGGGTGTGAAPVIAKIAREMGILTVGVVTKPFHFEGGRRMRTAEAGINELHKVVDTLLIIPNQNLFRVANEKTTFADAFAMADQVLYSGVACITDLMVKEGLINLDFADVRAVMREMGKAMMGTGEASGDKRALTAAEAAIANPLIDDSSMKGAKGLLISITGGKDLTLFEVDEAATRIREEVDQDANIIVGATFDEALDGLIRVSVVATGIEQAAIARNTQGTSAPVANAAPQQAQQAPAAPAAAAESRLADLTARLRADNQRLAERAQKLESQIPAAAPRAAACQCRTCGACGHRGCRFRSPAGARADADLWRRHGASDRAEAHVVSRARAGADGHARADDAGNLHPAAGRACPGARAADAAPRRAADAGPGRASSGPWRGGGGDSAEDPSVAAPAPRQCRPRPSRRGDRGPDRRPHRRSRHAGAARSQAAADGAAADRRQRTGVGICPPARAAGSRRPWPPGTCCAGATGRRPS